jgi:N4-gp56 family major capsid protein
MAIQQTTDLTNSIRTQYLATYLDAAYGFRLYEQLCVPFPGLTMEQAANGTTVQYPFLSGMTPATTELSQTADVTPQVLRDAAASVTTTSRGDALQWHEQVDFQTFTDYGQKRFQKLGENMMESIELLAQTAATTGAWVERAAARASLDAGTATHRASDTIFSKYDAKMRTLKIPGYVNQDGSHQVWSAIMHPYVFHDLRESGNVDVIGQYQDMGIHLRWELGQIGSFRLVVSPYAKTFAGAGADNATAVATTLAAPANALSTQIKLAADVSANIAAGELWTIGTEETADIHYPTNERVKILSADATDPTILNIIGEGENGGLRFDHAAGEAVRNADSVYTITFGGPSSLVKVFEPSVGEFGEVIGPKKQGLLDQWASIGWKWYGGYGLLTPNRILRFECSVSLEA